MSDRIETNLVGRIGLVNVDGDGHSKDVQMEIIAVWKGAHGINPVLMITAATLVGGVIHSFPADVFTLDMGGESDQASNNDDLHAEISDVGHAQIDVDGVIAPEALHGLLNMVDDGHSITVEDVSRWTSTERHDVELWAMVASDPQSIPPCKPLVLRGSFVNFICDDGAP